MVGVGLMLCDWASLALISFCLFSCHQPFLSPWGPAVLVVASVDLDGLQGLGQTVTEVAVSCCAAPVLSLSWRWGGGELLAWGEVSVVRTGSQGSPSALAATTVPQDLMDVSVSTLPSLWQPSPRQSSCSSCSQTGPADGGSTNGCNHERYEGLGLCAEEMRALPGGVRAPISCPALNSGELT